MAVKITFNLSDKLLAAVFRQGAEVIVARLVKQLNISMIKLQSYIVTNKLSGQVLHHRTGKLAGSINAIPASMEGGLLTAGVEGAGGPAWYGVVHEYGGTREYEILPVHKKALAFFPGESIGAAIGRMPAIGVGKGVLRGLYKSTGGSPMMGRELRPRATKTFASMGGIVVRKVIHPPLPSRPFMSTSLEEMRMQIVDDLRAAVMGGE